MFTSGKNIEDTKTYITSNQEGVKEEDIQRYNNIIDVLLAAGYFRVRIATLSPFDKVIGGLCWCISNSNVDVDVDVGFEEDSNIGQKIKVSEKVVNSLKRMKCPNKIQSFQIQGLDFAAIYEVLQWLVKKVFETREENRVAIKRYSELLFGRDYELPVDTEQTEKFQKALPYMNSVKDVYKPKRKYKRSDQINYSEWGHVQSVLLEYGREYKNLDKEQQAQQQQQQQQQALRRKSVKLDQAATQSTQLATPPQPEIDLDALKKNLTDTTIELSSMSVNKIFELHSEAIKKENEIYQKATEELTEKLPQEDVLHQLKVTQLHKQAQVLKNQYKEKKQEFEELKTKVEASNEELEKYRNYNDKLQDKLEQIAERINSNVDKEAYARIQKLVALNEALKKQDIDFRNYCKTQMAAYKEQTLLLESQMNQDANSDILSAHQADLLRIRQLRKLLSNKNKQVAILQRQLDEVPSGPELSQYERRFTDLHGQLALQFDETRKYYDTFNTLSETKKYLEMEDSLLNSISEYFQKSLVSKAKEYKPWMVGQVEKSVDAVRRNKEYVDKKLRDEKVKKDEKATKHQELVGIKRNYFRAVKDLESEYKKNEELRNKAKLVLQANK
ncbi:hypothetical protein AKO1_015477 [Acrasis kona]|uniref:Coiled-coil domain-containing protein 93 n=1 Tax=Acrasis kona TaxID=1008807 RepID=A0AAW2ZEQ1_9EUKA